MVSGCPTSTIIPQVDGLSMDPLDLGHHRSQYVSISGSYFMHRKPESDLFPLDTELERTMRNLRKVRSAETTIMAEERMGQTVE